MPDPRVAFVTGASRGIGRACAVELARSGFDVVLTARTVTGAERLEHSSTVRASNTAPLPGSLRATAAACEALGARTLVVKLDLARRADWGPAVDAALARFGRIDVLVNNGRYVGPGHMDAFEDTPDALVEQMFVCNVFAPLALIRLCLPAWKRQGSGVVINVTSSAVIGLMPGFVATERMAIELGAFGFDASKGQPPEHPGRVCALLASARDPMAFTGRDVHGPTFYAEHAGAG